MKQQNLICTVCPLGCDLLVTQDNGAVSVSGNRCARGLRYAQDELTAPKRTLTASVQIISKTHRLLPVKSSSPIPKELVAQAVALLAAQRVHTPVLCGDVIYPNILNTGVDIIACRNIVD